MEGKEKGKEVGQYKIAFWNVVGLLNKDRGFWMELKKWDMLFLMET